MKMTALLLAPALLTGCATDADRHRPERRVMYLCNNGPALTVTYAGDVARIQGGGGAEIVLPRRVSGSGFWYESPTHSLRGKGAEVIYTVGRMAPMTCTVARPRPR